MRLSIDTVVGNDGCGQLQALYQKAFKCAAEDRTAGGPVVGLEFYVRRLRGRLSRPRQPIEASPVVTAGACSRVPRRLFTR